MNFRISPKRLLVSGVVAGSLLIGVAAGAAATLAATAASAASPSPTPSSNSASSSAAPTMPAHGTAAHENAEVAVTGANATKAQAAAVKALGGGTAGAVTTDYTTISNPGGAGSSPALPKAASDPKRLTTALLRASAPAA